MKLKLLTAAATAALMAVPSLASADDSGWYLRGNVGYGAHTDIDLTGDVVGDVQSEGNATGSIGLGYDFGNNWRLELDGASLWTDLGAVSGYPQSSSKLRTRTTMLNAIYDFSDFGRWAPYVGAGLGVARASTTTEASDFPSGALGSPGVVPVNSPACPNGIACGFKNSTSSLGWQVLAGLGYDITEKLVWDTQYRYLNVGDVGFLGSVNPVVNGAPRPGTFTMENVGAHSLMTGFRYKFGATAPAMQSCWDGSSILATATCPAKPIPMKTCWDGNQIAASDTCPARPMQTCWDGSSIFASDTCPARPTFTCSDGSIVSDQSICPIVVQNLCPDQFRSEIIYYEFDKGKSAETRNAIQQVLDAGQYCKVDNIRVVGHTDTSGSAAYNLALSQRRASDARSELVRQGMDGALITSEGKGETELRVQTGDGVKEQQNRRTEVLLQLSQVGGVR